MAPSQVADGHQSKRRTASGLRRLKHLLTLVGESIEIDNGDSTGGALKDIYGFTIYIKYIHLESSILHLFQS